MRRSSSLKKLFEGKQKVIFWETVLAKLKHVNFNLNFCNDDSNQ